MAGLVAHNNISGIDNSNTNTNDTSDVEEGLVGAGTSDGGEGTGDGSGLMKVEEKDGIVAVGGGGAGSGGGGDKSSASLQQQLQQQHGNSNSDDNIQTKTTSSGADATTTTTTKKKKKTQREMNPMFKDVNETGSWGELSRKEVYIAIGVLAAVLVAVVVVVVTVVVTNGNNNNEEIVDAPTRSPTQAPTPMPAEEELTIVLDAIGSNPVTASLLDDLPNDPAFYEGLLLSLNGGDGSDASGATAAAAEGEAAATPQQLAMSWLLYEDTIKDPSQSTLRWAFASFYFQTGGADGTWTSSSSSSSSSTAEGWLSPTTPVCQWEHISCELNGNLQELDFDSVNLVAEQIPIELSLLSDVQSILLQNNQIQGTIDPDVFSVRQLPRLGLLYLNNNLLTGTVPEGLTQEESGGLRKLVSYL